MFTKIAVHRVGNKINQDALQLSTGELQLSEELKETLQDYFLKGFKTEQHFHFYSNTYMSENFVFTKVSELFEDEKKFLETSQDLARQIYNLTENPRVASGELFLVLFPADESEGERFDRIGIFKTENREGFLKIDATEDPVQIEKDFGISLKKIDKAALIYNTDKENGYVVSAIDNNRNGDDYYWFEDFLKIKQREDDYFHTQETLAVYKDYITQQLPQEFEISKADQADFLNKSIIFFKEKEEFKYDDFVNEVLRDDEVIESFGNFKSNYESDMQVSISEDFPINASAVKKQQRYFKSIIKLDKNFHIYIHGDRKLIETGEDEKGKFYRLYFEKEN